MRILYVTHGHFWESTWPYAYIDHYIIETLKDMGHEVRVFDFYSRVLIFYDSLNTIREINKLTPEQFLVLLEERASADLPLEVLEFEPDFLLHIVGRLSARSLKAIKKIKVPAVVWFLDDPQELKITTHKGLFYDFVYTVEPEAVKKYLEAGSSKVAYLPLGCFPKIQKFQEVPEKYHSDICFVGVAFPNRVEFFDQMANFFKDYKIKIIGGGPNIGGRNEDAWFWAKKLKRLDVYHSSIIDEVISPEEAAKYYNGAKINLNLHRTSADDRFANDSNLGIKATGVNGRTFEIAGCAVFQLIDTGHNTQVFFEEGRDIVSFKDENDLKEKIQFYLTHENERKSIAAAGYEKTIKNHTYEKRLEKIITNFV